MNDVALELAWKHLQTALEMWEGEVWRSQKTTAGWALEHTRQARKLLDRGHQRLNTPQQT